MKFQNIAIVTALLFFIYSCKKESSRDQPYKDVLTSGSWHISSLHITEWILGSDSVYYDTSVYDGYHMIFTADGKLLATTADLVSATGTWYQYSYEGIGSFLVRIEIGGDEFSFLNGTWTFLTHSLSQIDLDLRSFGTAHTMTLIKD
jgi:hypothetical protein